MQIAPSHEEAGQVRPWVSISKFFVKFTHRSFIQSDHLPSADLHHRLGDRLILPRQVTHCQESAFSPSSVWSEDQPWGGVTPCLQVEEHCVS